MSTPVSPVASQRGQVVHPDLNTDLDVDIVVVGAGASGLGTAAFHREAQRAGQLPSSSRLVVVEAAAEPGGYCRTVVQDGFVFDYAGHFFHFRDPSIHAFVAARLPPGVLRQVDRRARVIDVDGCEVAFPYQAHVASLPVEAARRCLVDLWHAENARGPSLSSSSSSSGGPATFRQWLQHRLGRGLSERFLVPYNEKLYATDLDNLDPGCMGRFFPEVRFADVVGAASRPWGYNATFTYPVTGAVTYIDALRRDLDPNDLLLGEPVTAIDLAAKVATTTRRRIRYRHLVTSAPLPRTLAMCGVLVEPDTWSWNRVLVFNLGFDRKGPLRPGGETHWLYVARRDVPFYRVGFYDAITGGDRLSLYVEVGLPATGPIDVDGLRDACLAGLRTLGIVVDERLVSQHHVVMDPAYVHLTPRGMAATSSALAMLSARQVHSIGRYGAWTYCSIEDNLLQARALVDGPLRVQD